MRIFIATILLFLSSVSRAVGAADAKLGYVVRVDSSSIILDYNDKSGAAVGQNFIVFKEGDELKHPVTHASMGRMEVKVAEGTLKEILPMYSVGTFSILNAPAGTISISDPSQPVTPGMRTRLEPLAATPPQPAAVVQPIIQISKVAEALGMTAKREPRWRGPAFDYQATALAIGDCRGDGKLEAAVSDGRKVYLYAYPPADAKPLAVFSAPGTAPRIYSLEAADLNGNGRAEVFVSYFNDAFNRFETKILELDQKGEFVQVAELPYLVRGYQDYKGARHLATQQITEDASFPFGAIYPLAYHDGKYGPGKPALDFSKRRVDWLYDFDFVTLDNKPATVDVTNTELLRVRFPKGSWKTSESYCQTPNRVRWTGDRMLHFRPAMAVRYDDKGFAGLYAIKNIGALGTLASPFGIFARAELHRLDWSGLSMAPTWVAELGGYSTGLALVPSAGGSQELAVMVVGTAGRSSIWAYEP
ncbi:MAG: VCBS repeat-containing protein [Elusimicrobia bacterium]|nr:VCBS repeat-containing protein [Elusimicrobiota bacterium]